MSDWPDEAYRRYVQERLPALQRLACLLRQDRHRADDLVQDARQRAVAALRRALPELEADGAATTRTRS